MKKRLHYGLVFISLFVIFSFTTGCFGGLDDAQEIAATYINALYAKSDSPTAEERYQKIVSTISTNADENPSEHRDDIIKIIQEAMIKGLNKPYYIADNLNDPQSDTRRSVIIRIPKDAIAVDEFNTDKDTYVNMILIKEGDDWKILDFKHLDDDTPQGNIEWKEVSPTDYLE
ncbi:hypothetical protein MK805_00570 [Shimazuella sp. AN120528]|uniref:hypothetical protein n=1 Tax=Shimazuella soli TaxID=1892854 RepID=UPI001F110A33|nr:hypothetical protein [Shimazuella soli]MCH5583466.1 hypothetical protein [Shimazuella soli]